MPESIVQRAPKGHNRVLIFSNETGACRGYCDFHPEEYYFLGKFLQQINSADEPGLNPFSAICVDEAGNCIHPLKIRAQPGKFAVVSQTVLCEDKILSQHNQRDDAVREATETTFAWSHTTQGLSGWAVIDDRGIVVWRDAHHYHQQKKPTLPT